MVQQHLGRTPWAPACISILPFFFHEFYDLVDPGESSHFSYAPALKRIPCFSSFAILARPSDVIFFYIFVYDTCQLYRMSSNLRTE